MDPEELELESIQHWLLALTRPGNRAVHWLQEKSAVMNTLVLNLSIQFMS